MEFHQVETKISDSANIIRVLKERLKANVKEGASLNKTEEDIYCHFLKAGRIILQEYVDSLEKNLNHDDFIQNAHGEALPYKKEAEKEYLSIFGPITIKRAYYWKKDCTEGISPLDHRLNLPEGKFSYTLQDMALRLLISGPYREALETVERIFKVKLWPEAIKAMVIRASSYVNSFYKGVKNYSETEGPVIAVTMDCKGIPMVPTERSTKKEPKVRREKGDKRKGLRCDAVVTSHFTFYPASRTPQDLVKALMHQYTEEEKKEQKRLEKEAHLQGGLSPREPINKQTLASMDGKEKAFERLAEQLLYRNPKQDKKIIVLIDRASSLENRFKEEVKKRKWRKRVDAYILDIFHATEYLWEAGNTLYGEKNPKRQKWVEEKLTAILEGRTGRVVGAMREIIKKDKKNLITRQKESLQKTITYFENHKHMMKYNEYLQKGYPIGTGVIEGACGCLVKDRTDRSGMKWTHEGVQAILNLRAVNQNGDRDKYFGYYMSMEQQRLYKKNTTLVKN
jgi:hypothetical protein